VNGWDDTDAIGLPVGFAATLVLVFVRRLPRWMSGEPSAGRERSKVSRRMRRLPAAGPWTAVPAVALEEDVLPGLPLVGWAVLPGGDTFGFGVFTVRSSEFRRVRKNTVPSASLPG
jgi:hypothetical protein